MTDDEIREKLIKFYEKNESTHDLNRNDFEISKNFAAGNGLTIWQVGDRKIVDRAQVPVNLLEPIINSVVFKFTENPFEFKIKDQAIEEQVSIDSILDKKELKFQLSSCLREICTDGISYLLVYKKDNHLELKRLNNFNVVMDECDFADGQDCNQCVIIEKKKKKKSEFKDVDKHSIRGKLINKFNYKLKLAKDECAVITYYFKECYKDDEDKQVKGVRQLKIIDDEIIENVLLPIEHIPIVRFYGKECPIDDFKKNWRGFYYLVRGLLKNIDMTMSIWQERLFTSETFKYWIPEESIGSNTKQYSVVNGFPSFYKTYKAFKTPTASGEPQTPMGPPTKVDMTAPLDDLALSYATNKATIYEILGTVAGEEKGNETAEAVLLRREAKDTAVNDMIKNLLDSSWQLCQILKDFTDIEFTITSDLFDKAKKQRDLEKIMALIAYVQQNPMAASIFPVMLAKLDIDDLSKEIILQNMAQQMDMQAQQNVQMQQMQEQIEQLTLQNMQLSANNDAQKEAAAMSHEVAMTRIVLDAEVKGAEIELEYAKLGQKEGENLQKLEVDVAKIQTDAHLKLKELSIKRSDAGN